MLRGLDFFSTKTAESQGSSAAQGGEEGQQNRREMSLEWSNRNSLCERYDFKATSKTAQSSIGVRRMQHHIYRQTCKQNCTDHNVLGRQGRERAERGRVGRAGWWEDGRGVLPRCRTQGAHMPARGSGGAPRSAGARTGGEEKRRQGGRRRGSSGGERWWVFRRWYGGRCCCLGCPVRCC